MKIFKVPRFFRLFFPNKTWNFSASEKVVYLTFDDGPDPEITPWLLDFLANNKIVATFFCVGENVRKFPGLYARILAEGHAVGNHSMRHQRGINVSLEEYVQSVELASQVIDTNLFRPPYGRMTLSQTYVLRKKYAIIMWSWLSFDYDTTISVGKIIAKAKRQIQAGDILVLHDNSKTTDRLKVILPEIVEITRDKGLGFSKIQKIKK